MTKLSDSDIKQIIELYEDNTNTIDIAQKFKVSQWTIYYRIKTSKLPVNYSIVFKKKRPPTEVRLCNCIGQQCRGRFLVRKDRDFLVCPYEAVRLKIISDVNEFYK